MSDATKTTKETLPAPANPELVKLVDNLRKEQQALYTDQVMWRNHFKQIADYLDPYAGRYLDGTYNNDFEDYGRRRDQYRINSIPSKAVRVWTAGLSEGLTPQSRPWMKLKTVDDYYMGSQRVKEWLYMVEQMIYAMMEGNAFYSGSKSVYREIGEFGSAQMGVFEQPEKLSFCKTYTIGEFNWGLDGFGQVGVGYNRARMSAWQMQREFGYDALPVAIQQELNSNNLQRKHTVFHAVFPNDAWKHGRLGKDGYKWRSIHFTESQDAKEVLRDSGFYTKPLICPRAQVFGGSVFGISQGMECLGDVKMLQKLERDGLQALDHSLSPPTLAPIALRPIGLKLYPKAVNYYPSGVKPDQVQRVFDFNFDFATLDKKIEMVQERIKDDFFYNIFFAVLGMEKQATAFEVARRMEEKIMSIGPILDNLKTEFIAPVVERHYDILVQNNLLPEMPPELPQGTQLKIEYTSILAQAQRMIGTSTYEQALDFSLRMKETFGDDVLDNVDKDKMLRDYFEMNGMPPTATVDESVVRKARAARAQQIQAMQQMQMAQAGAKAARDASGAQMGSGNMLEKMAGMEQGK